MVGKMKDKIIAAVRPEEVLSNSVYIYDRAAGELRIA